MCASRRGCTWRGGGGQLSTLASLTRLLLPWAGFHWGSWMRPLLVVPTLSIFVCCLLYSRPSLCDGNLTAM